MKKQGIIWIVKENKLLLQSNNPQIIIHYER